MRVYELAKELNVPSKDIIVLLQKKGFAASSHMTVVTDEAVEYVKQQLQKSVTKKKTETTSAIVKKEMPKKNTAKEGKSGIASKKEKVESRTDIHPAPKNISSEKNIVASIAAGDKKEKNVSVIVKHSELTHEKDKGPLLADKTHYKEIEKIEVSPALPLIAHGDMNTLQDIEEQEIREQERIRRLLKTTNLSSFAAAGGQQQGPRRRRRKRHKTVVAEVQQVAKGPVTEISVDGSKALYEVADLLGKNSGELILFFLKKGHAWNRNHVLNLDMIKEVSQHFNIAVHVKKTDDETKTLDLQHALRNVHEGTFRWPVVVVMGHVDHGKTTLLDYVRKMNVAASEKGGITQHIRAWDVDSAHGKIIFLDTPGHEAFSYLRQRGSQVTDLVVLVVAADDGIMPQTIEAIKHAKEAKVPVIVAINKIDKIQSPAALETVKRQLAQQDLMPEEWGGSTVVVPVSAKTGKGVDELLEMIVLQSQLMELKADVNKPAKAFVLESNIEKGFGPVATVICKEGTLKQGDYFICGSTTGKVRILLDSRGKKITQASPSMPVQVVGFDGFNGIEDWLVVVSQQEYARAKGHKTIETAAPVQVVSQQNTAFNPKKNEKFINIIIKTDTRGSKEALLGSIDKLQKAHKDIKCPIYIVSSGIGDIIESDIELAENTGSVILGLHAKVEKNAQHLAKEKHVDVQNYYIIYELVENLEKLLVSKKEILMRWDKVGEATVKKVFDIKGVGIIAGCYLRDGVLSRGNKVVCMRSGRQVGEGKITSLQRDRKSVKEIHAGYECGFTCDVFTEWQEGDTVLCYTEVKAE